MAFYIDIAHPAREKALKKIRAQTEAEMDPMGFTATPRAPRAWEPDIPTQQVPLAPGVGRPMSQAELIAASRTYQQPAPGSVAERYGMEQRTSLMPAEEVQDIRRRGAETEARFNLEAERAAFAERQAQLQTQYPDEFLPWGAEPGAGIPKAWNQPATAAELDPMELEQQLLSRQQRAEAALAMQGGVPVDEQWTGLGIPEFMPGVEPRQAFATQDIGIDPARAGGAALRGGEKLIEPFEVLAETGAELVSGKMPTLFKDGWTATVEDHRKRSIKQQIGLGLIFDPFVVAKAFTIPIKATKSAVRSSIKSQLKQAMPDIAERELDDAVEEIAIQYERKDLSPSEYRAATRGQNPLGNFDDPEIAFGADELAMANRDPNMVYRYDPDLPPEEARAAVPEDGFAVRYGITDPEDVATIARVGREPLRVMENAANQLEQIRLRDRELDFEVAKAQGDGDKAALHNAVEAKNDLLGEQRDIVKKMWDDLEGLGVTTRGRSAEVANLHTLFGNIRKNIQEAQVAPAAAAPSPAAVPTPVAADVPRYTPEEMDVATKTARGAGAVGGKAIVPLWIGDNVPANAKILDFGSGPTAQHTTRLREAGFTDVTAHEFGANIREGIHSPDALSQQYDVVFASNVLNVQSSEGMLRRTLESIRQALKEDGYAVFNYPGSPRKAGLSNNEVQSIIQDIFPSASRIEKKGQGPMWRVSGQSAPAPAAGVPTPVAAADEVVAPRFVETSKPRYRDATPEFDSPLDKALYIVADSARRSKRDPEILRFAMDATGLSEAAVRSAGDNIRTVMKNFYDEGADTFRVPRQYDAARVGREVVEQAPTPTVRPSTEALRTPSVPSTPMARVANFVNEPNFQFTPDNVIQDMSSQGGRDMVVVDVPNHGPQPFYRSTGKNSRKPGEWLPFDGISPLRGGWFDKTRFTGSELSEDMMRYGTPELKAMSERLTAMNIPEGQVIASQRDINAWLNTPESLGQNSFAEKLIPSNLKGDGPTPASQRAAAERQPQEPGPDIGAAGRGADDGPPPPRDVDGDELYDEFGELIEEPESPLLYEALDQAQELQNLDAPGAFGKFLDLLPGIAQIQRYARPANRIANFIMNAFIAQGGVRARLMTEMFAERESVIYPLLRQQFGAESLAGEKILAIRFIGEADEYVEEIGNTLLDIAQRPHLYGLNEGQQAALRSWQEYQTKFMEKIINGYGVKADIFPVREGAVFLSNVNIDDELLEALDIDAFQAIGRGRNKHRYFNTAADRYRSAAKKLDEAVIDKRLDMEQKLGRVLSESEVTALREVLEAERAIKFKAVTNIIDLQAGMDVWKARAASNNTFKVGSQGKTRIQVMDELHPKLGKTRDSIAKDLRAMSEQITTAERQLIAEAGELRRTETVLGQVGRRLQPILDRIDELESLGKEGWGPELSYLSGQARELMRNVRLLEQQGVNIGERGVAGITKLMTFNRRLGLIADQLDTVRAQYNRADIGDYELVTEGGLFQYYHAKDAKVIRDLHKASNSMVIRGLEEVRGTAFAGDFSPLFGVQMPLAFMANPYGVVRSLIGAVADSAKAGDVLRSFRTSTLADVVADDLDGWADLSFYSGRGITAGTPQEFAGGLLRFLPGFNKANEAMYSVILRQTKALYDQQLSILMKQGVPIEEAKATAADLALKVVPMWSPRRLGLSPGREAAVRAGVTSISFLTKPAELMATASVGFAKLITKQTLTPQELLATRVVTTMGATWMSLSVSMAVLDAKTKGRDPWEAAKKAMTPNSGSFGTIKLPGTDMSIPMGGPIRGIVQAVTPQMKEIKGVSVPVPFAGIHRFFMNRMTPFLRTQLSLAMDRDFYGGKVSGYLKDKESSNWGKLIRGLAYEFEGMVPLTIGATMGGIRRGLSDATQPMIDVVEIVKDGLSQLGGFNLFVESPYTKGDYAAQKWARENGIRGYREELPDGTLSEGVEIKRRGDLSPRDEQRFLEEYDYLEDEMDKHMKRMALQKVDWAVTTYDAQITKEKYAGQQEADDKALGLYIQLGPQPDHDNGTMKTLSPKNWRDNRRDRMLRLATERDRIYKDLDTEDPKTATDRYYQQFDIIKEKHNDQMTPSGWDELDRWVSSQSEYDQKWIEENTRLHALTPLVQEYYDDQKILEGYWQLEEDFLEHIRINHMDGPDKGAEVVERYRRYKDAPDHSKHLHGMEDVNEKLGRLKKAYRIKDGTLASIMAGEDGDREKGRKVDVALAKWGYGGEPISEKAREYLIEPVTPNGYNQPIGSTQPQPLQMQATPSGSGSFIDSLLGGTPTSESMTPSQAPVPTPSGTGSFIDSLLVGAR